MNQMSRRGKFLFVLLGVDGGGGGQLTPAFALIRRLVGRGHEVRAMGSPALAQRVRERGAIFVPLRLLPQPVPPAGVMVEEQIGELFAFACSSMLAKDVLQNLEGIDVLAADCMLPAALFAGELKRIPTVALVHMLYQWYAEGGGAELFDVLAPFVRQARFELGLPALLGEAPLMSKLMNSAALSLALTLAEFDSPLKRTHSNLRYVGPALDEEATKWEPPGRPLVLVSFSTTYMHHEDALRRTFAALDGIDAFAVCTLGHALSRDRMPVSPNVSIYDWLPHEAILPHAAAVVTHAGHSTVMAALAHGVPLVCMPMGRDQDTNAERVEALGAGVTLPPSAAPAEISAAIRNVLANPSYRDAAGRLAAQIRELGRGGHAVGELESLLK